MESLNRPLVLSSLPGSLGETRLVIADPVTLKTPWTVTDIEFVNGPAALFTPVTIETEFIALDCVFRQLARIEGIDPEDPFNDEGLPVGLEFSQNSKGDFRGCHFYANGRMLSVKQGASLCLKDCAFLGGGFASDCRFWGGALEARDCIFNRTQLVADSAAKLDLLRCDFLGEQGGLDLQECQLQARQCAFMEGKRATTWATISGGVEATFRLCDFQFQEQQQPALASLAQTPFARSSGSSRLAAPVVRLEGCLWNGEVAHTDNPAIR